jgi:hypothetical protein
VIFLPKTTQPFTGLDMDNTEDLDNHVVDYDKLLREEFAVAHTVILKTKHDVKSLIRTL